MAIETRKPLGIAGLNLGTDQSVTRDMVVADGARYDILGGVTGRLGRDTVDLVFPDEGVGNPALYAQTITDFHSEFRTRGFAPYYDQRIVTQTPEELNQPNFVTNTPAVWALAGGWVYDSTNQLMGYIHNGGPNTLTQTVANRAQTAKAGVEYILEYDVRSLGTVANAVLTLAAGFPAAPQTLNATVGRHRKVFTSAASPGDFVIQITSTAGGGLQLDSLSLKRVISPVSIPQRLNIIYKSGASLFLNGEINGNFESDFLFGNLKFEDTKTRAKIVTRGRVVYIIDSSTHPYIMRPRPPAEQKLYERVRYDVRRMGINWPRSNDDKPIAALVVDTPNALPQGLWRFRVALENKMGDVSNMSLSAEATVTVPGQHTIAVSPLPRIPDDLNPAINVDGVSKYRIYVSYQGGYIDGGNNFVLNATGPGDYVFWKSVALTSTGEFFRQDDYKKLANSQLSLPPRGAPPKLRDFIVVGDVGYGIAEPDVIVRELLVEEGEGRPVGVAVNTDPVFGFQVRPGFSATRFERTEIREQVVTPDMLFISPPGEPHYMESWVRFGRGEGEHGIGLSVIGSLPVIFTNQDIIVYDPAAVQLRRVHSSVGCLSRDSIQKTEDGVRFLGSDGVPRLFNGATVSEVADELLPIFSKPDYTGYYPRFDRTYAHETSTASGNRRFYMNYPVAVQPGNVPSKPTIDSEPQRNFAVADSRHQVGRPLWAVDGGGYEQIQWLGRESRLIATDFAGRFFYIEEGFTDADTNTPPPLVWAWRWFGGGQRLRFRKIRLEIDTKGHDLSLLCCVDENTGLQATFPVSTTVRQEIKLGLPGNFRGLYLEARLLGVTTRAAKNTLPVIYDIQVERNELGVF